MGSEIGDFEIKMDHKWWQRWREEGGSRVELGFGLVIRDNPVLGNGFDEWCAFYCEGDYDQDSGVMNFMLHFFDRDSMDFRGKHKVEDKGRVKKHRVAGTYLMSFFRNALLTNFQKLQLKLILTVAGQIWQILQISAVICRIPQNPTGVHKF